jgi:hypothetical protein
VPTTPCATPSCTDVSRVLRSHDPVGVEQEIWALLTLYQVLRRTMVEAAESSPGTDPNRCNFTLALQTARDLLVCAQGIFEPGIGEIGGRVLSALSPARRTRVSTRKVKSRENTGNGKTGSHMVCVLAIMQAEPERLWRSREIAEHLGDVTLVATYRQLARWTERGMIKRARTGRYTAITQMTTPLRDLRKR